MEILDVCCGSRMFWYDKEEPHTTYMDIRKAVYTATDREKERRIEINPDEALENSKAVAQGALVLIKQILEYCFEEDN